MTIAASQVIAGISWPIATIDFEASSLSSASYPIEAGVCVWLDPESPIQGWSTLIKPTTGWLTDGDWDEVSASIHKIPREDLEAGLSPTATVERLNAFLGAARGVGWCDGGAWDVHWAKTLAKASNVRPTFRVGHIDMMTAKLDQFSMMRMLRWLDRNPPRHRARDDAERLMKALARGLRLRHGSSIDISDDG